MADIFSTDIKNITDELNSIFTALQRIENKSNYEVNSLKNTDPLIIRKKLQQLTTPVDQRENFFLQPNNLKNLDILNDIAENIRKCYDRIKENHEKVKIMLNNAKIGTLQTLAFETLKNTGVSPDASYTIPTDNPQIQEALIHAQRYNENDSRGGKSRKSSKSSKSRKNTKNTKKRKQTKYSFK
jgi:hypothetical protein